MLSAESKSLYEDFSLIILTYNRYDYLLRALQFYLEYDLSFSIVVLDSSSDELESPVLKNIFSSTKVIYRKFESDIFFANKLAQGMDCITTSYAAICADDDFLIPSSIAPCIRFLATHLDYSCAQGLYILHSIEDGQFKWAPLYIDSRSSISQLPHQRLEAYLNGNKKEGGINIFGIYRSRQMKLIWKESIKYVSDWGLSELFPSGLGFLYGKRKILPILYSSRESNHFVWYDQERHERMYTPEKCELAIMGFAVHLSEIDGMSFENAEQRSRMALISYVDRIYKKSNTEYSGGTFIFEILGKIKTRIKYEIYGLLYSQIFSYPYSRSYPDFIRLKRSILTARLTQEELKKSRATY